MEVAKAVAYTAVVLITTVKSLIAEVSTLTND